MKSATRSSLFVLIGCQIDVLPCPIVAFAPSQSAYHSVTTNRIRHHVVVSSVRTVKFAAINDGNGEIDYGGDRSIIIDRSVPEDIGLDIVRGRETEISDETWSDIEGGAPSQWMVMKDVSSRYDTIMMCRTLFSMKTSLFTPLHFSFWE